MSSPEVAEEEADIFSLYDPSGKEERKQQRKDKGRSKAAQATREVGLGLAQGAGDIVELGSLPGAGIHKLISLALGEDTDEGTLTPGLEARIGASFGDENLSEFDKLMLLTEDDDLMPMSSVPGSRGALSEGLESIPQEGALQEGVRRGTRSVPGLIGGPAAAGEMAVRELMGMGGKEIGKQMGLPEWGQDLMDVAFSLSPLPLKGIKPTAKIIDMAATGKTTTVKELVESAKRFGMSEAEIAPLVREGWFADLLAKVSPRRGPVKNVLHQTKAAVGRNFDVIKDSEAAAKKITPGSRKTFTRQIEKKLADLGTKEAEAISGDLKKLYASDMSGRDLMVFWENVNSHFKDVPRLQGLKDPIRKALAAIDPQMGRDYEMINTLSNRFREVASKLKPNVGTDIFGSVEAMGLVGGIIQGNLPIVAGVSATAAGRKMAQMMLTNPRWQNLHKKVVSTINSGQIKATKKILDQMIGMVQESSPETAARLRTISFEELEEALKEKD